MFLAASLMGLNIVVSNHSRLTPRDSVQNTNVISPHFTIVTLLLINIVNIPKFDSAQKLKKIADKQLNLQKQSRCTNVQHRPPAVERAFQRGVVHITRKQVLRADVWLTITGKYCCVNCRQRQGCGNVIKRVTTSTVHEQMRCRRAALVRFAVNGSCRDYVVFYWSLPSFLLRLLSR